MARTLFSERLQDDQCTELEKQAALHKDGVLDDEEFKAEKARIIQGR